MVVRYYVYYVPMCVVVVILVKILFLLTLHRSAERCSHILPKLKHEVATEAHRKTRIGTIAALHFGRRSKSKTRNNAESSVVMDKVSLS